MEVKFRTNIYMEHKEPWFHNIHLVYVYMGDPFFQLCEPWVQWRYCCTVKIHDSSKSAKAHARGVYNFNYFSKCSLYKIVCTVVLGEQKTMQKMDRLLNGKVIKKKLIKNLRVVIMYCIFSIANFNCFPALVYFF